MRNLEVPLDNKVIKNVKETLLFKDLSEEGKPKWKSIKELDPQKSSKFQEIIKKSNEKNPDNSIHLDVLWWGQD